MIPPSRISFFYRKILKEEINVIYIYAKKVTYFPSEVSGLLFFDVNNFYEKRGYVLSVENT